MSSLFLFWTCFLKNFNNLSKNLTFYKKCANMNKKIEGSDEMLEICLALIFDPNNADFFEEIYHKYEKYVFKVARYYVKDYHYTEDASQIAFKNIAIYIDKIKSLSDDALKVYIYRLTKHAAFLVLNKNIKNRNNVEYVDSPSNDDLLEKYVNIDKLTRIKKYVQSMDAKYKDILSLYFQNDLNFREISEMLNLPKTTVKTRFYKAMSILKEKFKEEDYD